MWVPAAKTLKEMGGFTVNHKNGRILNLEGHYVVGGGIPDNNSINAHPGFSKMALGTITKVIADFANKYRNELGKKDCYLGGWISDDSLYLDVSNTETDRKRAHLLSLYRKELAIYFSDTDGGRELDNEPIEEMFEKSFKYKVALEDSERAHQSFAQLKATMREKEDQLDQAIKELHNLKKRKRRTSRSRDTSTRRRSLGGLFTPDNSNSNPRVANRESSKEGRRSKTSFPRCITTTTKGS